MTYKVLLAGGRAAGRIVEVADDATSTTVVVPVLPPPGSDPAVSLVCSPGYSQERLTYAPQGDPDASGYPVWRHVAPLA